MLWWKSKGKDILRLVRVNDRIQLEVGSSLYLTRVEDIDSGSLFIGAPVEDGDVINLYPGNQIALKVFIPEGARKFSARVKRMYGGRLPIIEAAQFQDLGMIQRRKCIRIKAGLPIEFRKESSGGNEGFWRQGSTLDLSVGGLQIADQYILGRPRVGQYLEIRLSLPDGAEIAATCNMTRVQATRESCYRISVEFAQISAEAQNLVARYVERKRLEIETLRAKAA